MAKDAIAADATAVIHPGQSTDPRTAKNFDHFDGICLYILEYENGFRAMSCDDVWAGPAREGAEGHIYIKWRVEGIDGMASHLGVQARVCPLLLGGAVVGGDAPERLPLLALPVQPPGQPSASNGVQVRPLSVERTSPPKSSAINNSPLGDRMILEELCCPSAG